MTHKRKYQVFTTPCPFHLDGLRSPQPRDRSVFLAVKINIQYLARESHMNSPILKNLAQACIMSVSRVDNHLIHII